MLVDGQSISIRQRIGFDCSYMYKGDLSSHSYKFEVIVTCPQSVEDNGVVIEFSTLKSFMREVVPNNAFLVSVFDTVHHKSLIQGLQDANIKVVYFDDYTVITSEYLLWYLVQKLQDLLYDNTPGVIIQSAQLYESINSIVEWKK